MTIAVDKGLEGSTKVVSEVFKPQDAVGTFFNSVIKIAYSKKHNFPHVFHRESYDLLGT